MVIIDPESSYDSDGDYLSIDDGSASELLDVTENVVTLDTSVNDIPTEPDTVEFDSEIEIVPVKRSPYDTIMVITDRNVEVIYNNGTIIIRKGNK